MDFAADALKSATGKIDLDRLSHLKQYTLHIDLMPRLKLCLCQLHDHERISILIILYRPLSHLDGWLPLGSGCGRQRFYFPTGRPGDHRISGMRAAYG